MPLKPPDNFASHVINLIWVVFVIRREDAANETHGPNKAKILGAYSRAHNFQVIPIKYFAVYISFKSSYKSGK